MATTQEKRLDPVVAQGDAEPQIGILPTKQKVGWNDIPPLRAPDNARNIYAGMGVDDLKRRASSTGQASPQAPITAATPAQAAQPKPASAGVDGIPTGGPAGWAGGATQPAPKTAFGDLQSTIQNQVEKAVWGSALTPTPSTGVQAAAAPATPAPALQNPLRVQEAKLGLSNPGTAPTASAPTVPASAPARNASGALTSMGAGTDVVGGIKKYVVDGKTLYSNMGDEGQGGNLSLMNRGAPSAQNVAAMDNLVARSTAEGAQAVQRLQFQDQVAQAKAINARPNPVDPRAALDITSPQYQAARLQNMEMRQKSGESPAAYQSRMQAMVEGQRTAQAQASEEARLGLGRDTLAANTKQADAKNAIDQGGLWIRQQQVANDQETGALTRDQKRMEIAAAKQLQALQAQLLDPKASDAQRLEIGKKIAALQGKTEKPDQWDSVVVNGGTDALGNKIGGTAALFNKTTGEYKQLAAGPGSSGVTPTEANINALKNNPNLAKDFDAKFGNGAAAKIIGAN